MCAAPLRTRPRSRRARRSGSLRSGSDPRLAMIHALQLCTTFLADHTSAPGPAAAGGQRVRPCRTQAARRGRTSRPLPRRAAARRTAAGPARRRAARAPSRRSRLRRLRALSRRPGPRRSAPAWRGASARPRAPRASTLARPRCRRWCRPATTCSTRRVLGVRSLGLGHRPRAATLVAGPAVACSNVRVRLGAEALGPVPSLRTLSGLGHQRCVRALWRGPCTRSRAAEGSGGLPSDVCCHRFA